MKTSIFLLLMLLGPVAGTFVTGPYSLEGLIEDKSAEPPKINSGFPITYTSSGAFPSRDLVWDFQFGQWVKFAFPEVPPNVNHVLEIQFGTYDNDFTLTISDCNGKQMVYWVMTAPYETPNSAIAWFNYLKIDLAPFCTTSFRVNVGSPYPPGAFMALSDIVSVWQVGVIDANYGIGVYRLPNTACKDVAPALCSRVLAGYDAAAQTETTAQVSEGGFVGMNGGILAAPTFVIVDFSFLKNYTDLSATKKPVIQLDAWNQFNPVTVKWTFYPTANDPTTQANWVPLYAAAPQYFIQVNNPALLAPPASPKKFPFGFPVVLTGLEYAVAWQLVVTLSAAMISNFFRVFFATPALNAYPKSVLIDNMAVTWADTDRSLTLFDRAMDSWGPGATAFVVCNPAQDPNFFFSWLDPANPLYANADQIWFACPGKGQTAFNVFEIPQVVATYHCPYMSFYPTESQNGPMKWYLQDAAQQVFMTQYMAWQAPGEEVPLLYFAEWFFQQTMSLRGVTPGPARLNVISPAGSVYAAGPPTVPAVTFSLMPYFRFFDLQGPCVQPTCDHLLSHFGTGSFFNQTCGTSTQQRQYLVADLNNISNVNCSVDSDNVHYAFVDVDNTPNGQGAWVNPYGIGIKVTDWGTADWGVITSFFPAPESYATLGITPTLGNYVGKLEFLFVLSKGVHNGTLDDSPTTFLVESHEPLVNLLVFRENERNGVPLESINGASFTQLNDHQYELVIPGNCYAVAGYAVGPGPSPDDGSDEALLGLLGLLAVPFLALSCSMACAWWFLSRPKVPPPMPVEYYPMPVQETLYWTEAPPLMTNPVAYPAAGLPFGVAPIPSPVW